MTTGNNRIKTLLLKHLKDELSGNEQEELRSWTQESDANRELFNQLSDPDRLRNDMQEFHVARTNIWEKIDTRIHAEQKVVLSPQQPQAGPTRISHRLRTYAAAAVILLLFTAGIYYRWYRHAEEPNTTTTALTRPGDRAPGGNKAVLTLSDGSVIQLDKAGNGRLTAQGATDIRKDSSLLAYTTAGPAPNPTSTTTDPKPPSFNTLTTPRSGQFQVVLPDGSKVWLNNASSLRYPTTFQGQERQVELLNGEAYFEIAPLIPNSGHGNIPFIVKVKDLAINVLGTSFNIQAYPDEKEIRTTLITGKVRLSSQQRQTLLIPGQQAAIDGQGSWTIHNDLPIDDIIAWKRGYFHFNRENISDVLRQLARWYDVEVIFTVPVPDYQFDGEIGRDLSLSAILKHLEKNDLHFHIEGNRLIVSN